MKNNMASCGGKGTHTAIPILINCMEAARDFKTGIYLSSWDIEKGFDSVGPEFMIQALRRLHVPEEIANYLVGIDKMGSVFLRTPLNVKLKNYHNCKNYYFKTSNLNMHSH